MSHVFAGDHFPGLDKQSAGPVEMELFLRDWFPVIDVLKDGSLMKTLPRTGMNGRNAFVGARAQIRLKRKSGNGKDSHQLQDTQVTAIHLGCGKARARSQAV